MGERRVIDLANRSDVHLFHVGKPVMYQIMTVGKFRRLTGLRLAAYRVRWWALHMTRWWRPRTVTSAVDVKHGSITLVTERWSWLRWRWERR